MNKIVPQLCKANILHITHLGCEKIYLIVFFRSSRLNVILSQKTYRIENVNDTRRHQTAWEACAFQPPYLSHYSAFFFSISPSLPLHSPFFSLYILYLSAPCITSIHIDRNHFGWPSNVRGSWYNSNDNLKCTGLCSGECAIYLMMSE